MTSGRARRIATRASLIALAATSAAAVVAQSAPADATGITLQSSAKTTITRGVQQWSVSWTNQDGDQHGYVMSVDLTVSGVQVKPGLGYGLVNQREATQGIAARTGAIGGVNGDLFDWDTSLPWGGVGINGVVYKTPKQDRPSQFYIRSDGKAGIGALKWSASVTQVSSTGRLGASHALVGVNTPVLAGHGYLSMFTPAIVDAGLGRCPGVSGPISGRTVTVKRVYSRVGRVDRIAAGRRLLAACGTAGHWLLDHARYNQRLRIAQSLTTTSGAPVSSFISGQRTLRLNGQRYYDKTGFHTTGINPETAACVSRDRQHILLIAVDGWIGRFGGGNGITLPELGDLTAALHCYSAVVFDGGGSTTMVEKRSGTLRVVNQMPAVYGQRPVSNALLVFKS